MNRSFRIFLFIIAIGQGIGGIAFALRVPVVTQLWLSILPGATPLSLAFVGSIFAAAAASTLWCLAVSGEDGALTGVALDYLIILIPVTIFTFQIAGAEGSTPVLIFAVLCVLGVIFGAILFFLNRNIPIRDLHPQPRIARISFGIFIVALLIVGGSMVLKVPNVIPWTSRPTSQSFTAGCSSARQRTSPIRCFAPVGGIRQGSLRVSSPMISS